MNTMRLRGLIRKESLQIIRDPSSIGIAFVLPVFLLLIFGYGVSLDARNVGIALVVEQPGPEASSLISGFRQSDYFAPRVMLSIQQAEQAMMERKVDGIVWLRADFARQLRSGRSAPVAIIVNGVDANKARLIEGYVGGVWMQWLSRTATAIGQPLHVPVKVEQRIWYNPAVRSRNYLVPGLIAVIMTLIGAMLTSMVVAREWERGTMEALLVTPVLVKEILLGKIIPYFILGMGGMLLSVAMAFFLFHVPLHGSMLALAASSALFMLTAIAMGLLISTAAGTQFVAGQIAIVVTFLPAFILSGFVFDINSMPVAIQWLTHLVPARYFVAILQTIFLAGDVWPIFIVNSAWLACMAIVFFLIIRKKSNKRLR
ncbi:MAG TPA: ABC transporter permease [Desulfobulbus sp.]|nr:ABC transporter permease [Desulfobulbus sp.]